MNPRGPYDPYEVLAAAAAEWDAVEPLLSPRARQALAAALRRLRGTPAGREAAARDAARLLTDAMPDAEGGRLVAAAPQTASSAGFRAEDLAALVLDRTRMVGPVLGPVRERLLAVPALSDEVVIRQGGDPYAAGLIRLTGEGGAVRLPRFQFSEDALPWLVVLEVNELLAAGEDPWGVADWWLSDNAWLAAPPASLLGTGRDHELVAVAHALTDGE